MAKPWKQRKPKITARKYMGDDKYSWAVFIDGRVFTTGLSKREVGYWKARAEEYTTRPTGQMISQGVR